jgi:hypothetical protein
VSVSALHEKPRFTWTTANPESDPIHRGNCGPGRCGNMLDFLDIVVSPVDGRVWATAVDTCDGTCASGETGQNAREGLAVRQVKGPTLRDKRR